MLRIRLAIITAIALGSAGCSSLKPLDLRCEPATKRIQRHQGEAWRMQVEDVDGDDQEEALDVAVVQALFKADESDVVAIAGGIPDDRCHMQDVSKAAPLPPIDVGVPKPLSSMFKLDGNGNSKPNFCLSPAELAVKTLSGKDVLPGDDIAKTPEEAFDKYLYERDIFLSPDRLTFSNDTGPIQLILINQGLNCLPDRNSLDGRWRCNKIDDESPVITSDTTLALCKKSVSNSYFDVVNLLGVIEDRYCLQIGIAEKKRAVDEFRWRSTNINRDTLVIKLTCATDDDAGPKAIVGGPKPTFIAPIKALSSE